MTELKKGISKFQLVGTVKLNDKTFAINQKSQGNKNYVYSQLNLGVDCGAEESNLVFAKMMGGYDTVKGGTIYCHGIKLDGENTIDDYDNQIKIDFADRNAPHEEVAKSCFISVGIVKDINDRTIEKKFLSSYDAIAYLKDNLTDGMVVNVRGQLKYRSYQGHTQVDKQITSIWVSSAKKENYRANFQQTVWFAQDGFTGEKDEENYLPIYGYVVDYYDKDVQNVCYPFTIDINTVKMPKYQTIITTYLRPKEKENINKVVVEGTWEKSDNTTEITFNDLSDDLKDMVTMGLLDEKEALGRAIGSSRSISKTLLKSICTRKDSETGNVTLLIDTKNSKVSDIVLPPQQEVEEQPVVTKGTSVTETKVKPTGTTGDDGDDGVITEDAIDALFN